eukprot:390633-Prymnesium_polylepis.1
MTWRVPRQSAYSDGVAVRGGRSRVSGGWSWVGGRARGGPASSATPSRRANDSLRFHTCPKTGGCEAVSYTHLRAHETLMNL